MDFYRSPSASFGIQFENGNSQKRNTDQPPIYTDTPNPHMIVLYLPHSKFSP